MSIPYETMVTIRCMEDRLQDLCFEGKAGDLHFSKGQEAISVGVCKALRPTDHIVTHHRTIAHAIAKGAELYPLVAEVLGKATGYNHGRAGEMHLSIPPIHYDFSFQLVGTCVPVAAGIAWALRYHHKTDDVVAVFFGDAASSNGAIHEALTIAALRRVPLLLICENNGLAGNVTPDKYLPTKTVSERMHAYGIASDTVDGNDIVAVKEAATKALQIVREGAPFLLECHTTRLCWHKQGQRDMRSKEVLAELSKRDPIPREAIRIGLALDLQANIKEQALLQVNEAIAKAESDPLAEFG